MTIFSFYNQKRLMYITISVGVLGGSVIDFD